MSLYVTDYDAEARVAAGAALLDEKGPKDWRTKVNLANFDLNSHTRCVLGQVFGTFEKGLRELGFADYRYSPSAPYAFFPEDSFDHDELRALTEAWVKELRENSP